jgi:Tol biopolymer transport system component
MRTGSNRISAIKSLFFPALLTLAAVVVLAGAYPGSRVRGAAASAPHVTAITQITHDGYGKSNVVADDSQVYVTELAAANRVIAKVTLSDSNRSLLSTAAKSSLTNLQALDLSSDHSKLLVSSKRGGSGESEFWILPAGGGSPVRVGKLTGRDATWSSDGEQLVYSKGSVLYVASTAGTEAHELYTATGAVFAPRVSPDGHRIRFTVSNAEQNTTSLWEVGLDGSNAHPLLGKWQYKSTACCGNWTADGRYYIFQASQTVPNTSQVVNSLWALSGADEEPVALTSGPTSYGDPWPAHDNKNIWAIGVQPRVEVVKYEARKKKYVPVIAGLSGTDVEYSADGNWVAYVAVPEGTLWRARANGKDRLQLTAAPDRAALPRWSPDGKQIAYASMKPGGSWKLSIVPADGGESKEMFPESGSQIDANWSKDGSRLLFGDYSGDAAGLSVRLLDFKTNKIETIPGSKGLFSPRWSPDGQYIAALSPDNTKLMRFDFQTHEWSKWITSAGAVNYPVWSADSQYLYYDDLVNGAEAIRRVKVGGSEAELVYELPSVERYTGALGLWSGRAADGSWMFVRDRSTQEVYQLSLQLP